MKLRLPVLRALAPVLFAAAAFAQADYSTPYTVTKYAGLNGVAGSNDGTINFAQLNLPIGVAFDASGNLYVADSGNQTIRKISPTGISSTFAGAAGALGANDGSGSNARFSTPSGVAVDSAGNVYVSDSGNHTIRKITAAGAVTTFAGSAGNYGSADGTGSAARFNNPIGLAFTSSGDLLVVDSNNHALRKVSAAGLVTTIAGSAGSSGSADGTGSAARFSNPHSVAIDGSGNIFVSDAGNHTIRKITAAGVVTTIAGTAGSSGSSDGTGGAARFNSPQGLAFDASGNLFVADSGNNLLRKISAAGAVATFAGATGALRSIDGTGAAARFQSPGGVAFDAAGTLHVSDFYNHTIRRVTAAAAVTTWLGSPASAGATDGIGAAGLFQNPYGIAIDAARNLYLADRFNHTIRKISAAGVVTTLAGSAGNSGSADGLGAAARFYNPFGVAVDAIGNVYVADQGNQTIRKITPNGLVSTLAGAPNALGSADGTGSAARFFSPAGVAVDASGTVFVADSVNQTIRKITADGTVSTFAGSAGNAGSADGTGSAARFLSPFGVAVDASGNVFVADLGNHTIRKISAAGVVTTVAGTAGTSGNRDGAALTARLNNPIALAIDPAGNLFLADFTNDVVRLVTPAGVVKTAAGGSYGSSDGTGAGAQFIDPAGIAIDAFGTLYVVDSSNNLIRRGLPPGAATFTTQPVSQSVAVGQSVTFSVGASGSGLSYQWQKNGANISGATSASYTIASPQAADAASYSVLVTSGGITAASAPATLGVGSALPSNPITITTQPASQTVTAGQSASFTVAATGTGLGYQWQKDGAPISGATSATYSIASAQSSDAGSYTVVISASGNSATSAAATLTVSPAAGGPTARLVNLSVLTSLATSGDTFTLGYVVGGSGTSGAKQLLVRAVGPTLGAAPFNVGGVLADPQIALFNASSTLVANNDNWGGLPALTNAFAAVGAFPYASANSLDAAALVNITTANNSVVISATDRGTGTVLAEIYDTTAAGNFSATTPRLVNVSVLKSLGNGLTAGFVVGGSGAMKVLVRAVGPTLGAAPFNVPGVVADPQLVLFNGASQPIANNDNWGGGADLSATFSAVGAFALPASSKDAAVVVTLTPGNYTVQVSGVANTTGVALVEVYEVP
jgi:sugar lactone lactonase YvrE